MTPIEAAEVPDAPVSQQEALLRLYWCLNCPAKAGRKWATYSRGQADAAVSMVRQLLVNQGFSFHPNDIEKGPTP